MVIRTYLHMLRTRRKLLQRDVIHALKPKGITGYGAFERGEGDMTWPMATALAEFYKLSLDWIWAKEKTFVWQREHRPGR